MIGSRTHWSGWAQQKHSFDPKSISGLVLWLTGASYSATTGTWTDLSGTGHHGTQGTAGARGASTTSAQLGGKATWLPDGIDDYLSFAAIGGAPLTLVAAIHPITTGGRLLEGTSSGGIIIFGSNTQIQLYSNGGPLTATVSAYQNSGFILTGVWNVASSVLRKGGVQIAAGNPGGTALGAAWVLGKGTAGGFSNTHVAELLAYNRDLNASGEISAVEKYLGTSYGVAA